MRAVRRGGGASEPAPSAAAPPSTAPSRASFLSLPAPPDLRRLSRRRICALGRVLLAVAALLLLAQRRAPAMPLDDGAGEAVEALEAEAEADAGDATPVRESKQTTAYRPRAAKQARAAAQRRGGDSGQEAVDAALRQAMVLATRRWANEDAEVHAGSGVEDGEVKLAGGQDFAQEFGVDEDVIRQALASDQSSKNGAHGAGGKHARGGDSIFDHRPRRQSAADAGPKDAGAVTDGELDDAEVAAATSARTFVSVGDDTEATTEASAGKLPEATPRRADRSSTTAVQRQRMGLLRGFGSRAGPAAASRTTKPTTTTTAATTEAVKAVNRTALRRHQLHPEMFDREGNLRDSYYLNHLPGRLEYTRCPGFRAERPDLGSDVVVYMPRSMGGVEDSFVHMGNYKSFFRRKTPGPFASKHLPEDMHWLYRKFHFKSCAIVGNSGELLKTQFGKSIDSHEVVIRLNQAPINGYEKHVGHKSTFRLLNALWSHRYCTARDATKITMQFGPKLPDWVTEHGMGDMNRPVDGDKLPLERGCSLISTRADDKQFEQLAKFWSMKNVERANEKKKKSDLPVSTPSGFRGADVRVYMLSSRLVSLARAMMVRYRAKLCKAGYGPYEGGNDPTSGLLAVLASLNWCKVVTAYGFGETFAGEQSLLGLTSPYHYYRAYGMREKGNTGAHTFEAESLLMQELLNSERPHPPQGHPWHLKERGQATYYRHNLRICRSIDNERGPDNAKGWCRAAGIESFPENFSPLDVEGVRRHSETLATPVSAKEAADAKES